jgi:hypothetical protein
MVLLMYMNHSCTLQGAAVAHAELGEYSEAASLLEKLTQVCNLPSFFIMLI